MPAIQILLFGIAIGQSPVGLEVALIGSEATDIDDDLMTKLGASDSLILHDEYTSAEEARSAIGEGELWAAIVVSDNGVIEVHLDNSNQQVSSTIMVEVRNALTEIMEEKGITPPVEIADPVYGDKEPAFINFLAPGIITLVCFMFSLILTTMSFVGERYDGTLDRVFAAGTQPSEVLVGHMIAFTSILVGQVSTVILIAVYGFDIPLNGNPLMVFVLAMLLGWAAMCIGMFIGDPSLKLIAQPQISGPTPSATMARRARRSASA